MCVICVDEAVAVVGIAVAAAPFYKTAYRRLCAGVKKMRAALLLVVAALFASCSPTLRCWVVDGVEVCQSRPQCRDSKNGQFIACPDSVTLDEMRATLRDVEKKAEAQK